MAENIPAQEQAYPGVTDEMDPRPKDTMTLYTGRGLFAGKRALITGGDSGIGRAVAIAFAREGADVLIAYLPEEEQDAQETAKWVRAAGRTVVTAPGDIQDEAYCESLVQRTVDEERDQPAEHDERREDVADEQEQHSSEASPVHHG